MEDAEFTAALATYRKALEDEWETQHPDFKDSPEVIAEKARKLVINIFPRLVERASALALGANSEAVSMQAVRFLYEIIVPSKTRAPGAEDPIDGLVRELTKNTQKENEER